MSRIQYTLRQSLVVTAIVASVCAVGAYITHRRSTNARVQHLVESLGGSCATAPGWFNDIIQVNMKGRNINDATVAELCNAPGIEYLGLSDTAISDAALDSIDKLAHLKRLTVVRCEITDKGLEKLDNVMFLEALYLNETKVTVSGLKHLARLPRLTTITVTLKSFTDAEISDLRAMMPKVSITEH